MYFHGIKLHSLKYPPNMLVLCWHSTPAYYAFYYAGIFDAGLSGGLQYAPLRPFAPYTYYSGHHTKLQGRIFFYKSFCLIFSNTETPQLQISREFMDSCQSTKKFVNSNINLLFSLKLQ